MKHKHVLMMPDYRGDNPYQRLLSQGIEENSLWKVDFYSKYHRVFPFFRASRRLSPTPKLFHLHWIDPYQKGKTLFQTYLYQRKILLDLKLLRLAGIPFVWTRHNTISHEARHPRLELSFYRKLARAAAGTIVHHKSIAQSTAQELSIPKSAVHAINHGHYRDFYGPPLSKSKARKVLGIPNDKKLFLFFGMLRPYKGIETLLHVWPRFIELCPDAFLYIAGSPKDEDYLRSLLSIVEQTSNVRLDARFIPDEEVSTHLSAADASVFPFKRILTSGSIILSLSYNCQVVAPDYPTVEETVFPFVEGLYNPNNPDGLINALTACAHRIQHSSLPSESNDWDLVRHRLSWSRIGKETADLYSRVSF